jgi:transmembrane sensor
MNMDRETQSFQSERLARAADWWLRLREPNVPPDLVAEWILWCEASPENKDAFASVQSLCQKAKSAPLAPLSRAELRADGFRRRLIPWALAASLGLGLLVATPWLRELSGLRAQNQEAIATRVGANREVILPDGSRVTLGGATALTVAYTVDRRRVALNSGEALFQVRPDYNRPFVVQTPTGAVAAVGTAFDVRTDGRTLRVTVSDGVVEVTASDPAAPVWLRVGQQAVLRPNDAPVTSAIDPHVVTAWTTGTLKFIDEPFDSVIAAVNRYSPTRIDLKGSGMSQLRYTGTVVSGRVDEWLAALPNVFPIEVVSQDSDRIIIRSRE